MTLNQAQRDELEQLVDRCDLASVLEALAYIAREKAEHLRSNWQDAGAARSWERDGAKLDRLHPRLEN